jgi:hypothetical protein
LGLLKGGFCPERVNGGSEPEITGNAPQNDFYGAFKVIEDMFLKVA